MIARSKYTLIHRCGHTRRYDRIDERYRDGQIVRISKEYSSSCVVKTNVPRDIAQITHEQWNILDPTHR